MKKLTFELETEKLCEEIFFNKDNTSLFNSEIKFEFEFINTLSSRLDCELIHSTRGGQEVMVNLDFLEYQQINWDVIARENQSVIEFTLDSGKSKFLILNRRPLNIDTSKTIHNLKELHSTGFICAIDFSFQSYKKDSSITISRKKAMDSESLKSLTILNLRLISNALGDEGVRYKNTELRYMKVNLKIDYHHYNCILNLDRDKNLKKIFLSRGAYLKSYFNSQGNIDIYHLPLQKSPRFQQSLKLAKADGIYTSWQPKLEKFYQEATLPVNDLKEAA